MQQLPEVSQGSTPNKTGQYTDLSCLLNPKNMITPSPKTANWVWEKN